MESTYPYRRFALFLLGMFFVWGGISYYWYACSIKNLCSQAEVVTTETPTTTIPVTVIDPTRPPVINVPVYVHTCKPYITRYIGVHRTNNPSDVARLEEFLSVYRNEPLVIDGVYGTEDIYAVRAFQKAYGVTPTGNVFSKTTDVINSLVCAQ